MKLASLLVFFFFVYLVNGIKLPPLQYASVGSKVCMKVLGCFEITPDFHKIPHRPINVLPQDRAVINTRFFLYTNQNIRERHILDADHKNTLKDSPLNIENPTKFIVHGYIDSELFGPWQEKLKDEILLKGQFNVIIVDWSGGNMLPYAQATSNTRVVGAEIAYLIKTMESTNGIKRADVHIIGHSLGSHVAGYAGERLPGLGRITGLDPAEPFFQNLPRSVRLDETDADFVDAIHTDSKSILLLGLGMSQLVGNIDFFPNNGQNQPGCTTSKFTSIITAGLIEGGRRFVACNHQRSVDFFTSTINQGGCLPVGFKCPSWEAFLEGKCSECGPDGSRCAIMGLRADETKRFNNTNLKLYLQTSGRLPYCLYHYQIGLKLSRTKNTKDVSGTLEVMIHGDMSDLSAKVVPKQVTFYAGSKYLYLLTSDRNVGPIRSVTLNWVDSGSIANPLNWFRTAKMYVEYVQVTPMNIINKNERLQATKKLCFADQSKPVVSKKPATFVYDKC